MANAPRSSFIPKQAVTATPKKVNRKRVFSVFGFLSSALLIASVVAGGGVFLYLNYLEGELEATQNELESARNQFNESEIASVHRFDQKIKAAKELLNRHLAPSQIFDALEEHTKERVQYTEFSYARRYSGDASLELTGVTDTFATVALQALQNNESFLLEDAAVTNIGYGGLDEESEVASNRVSFHLVSAVAGSDLKFDGQNLPVMPTEPETETATSSATTTPEEVEESATSTEAESDETTL